jgi:SAM-dependent methyltransferase
MTEPENNNNDTSFINIDKYRDVFGPDIFEIWEELQHVDDDIKRKNPHGYFAAGINPSEIKFNSIVHQNITGKCLDIGCGLLPLPSYMQNQPNIKFIGIDPHEDKIDRDFEFVHGIAEDLPFTDNEFDGVIFATSLDHVFSVEDSLKEAYRVLKQNSKIVIWYTAYDKPHYAGTKADKFHQWRLTDNMLKEMLLKVGFGGIDISCIGGNEHVLIAIEL